MQNAGHICDTKIQCHFVLTIYIICCCSHTLCVDLSFFPHLLTISIMCHYLIVTATVPRHTHVAAHTCRGFPTPTTSSIKSISPLSPHQSQALRERNMPSVITMLKQGPEAWDCLQLMDPRSDRPSVAPHLTQVWSPGPGVREEYSALSAHKSSLLKGTSQTEMVLRKHNVCATFWQACKVHMPKKKYSILYKTWI